uniref:Uncharacterized protein n=1 Tax=Arundo donax TaxID=35708 RepID=A0A0A8ZNS7_ARUDO
MLLFYLSFHLNSIDKVIHKPLNKLAMKDMQI